MLPLFFVFVGLPLVELYVLIKVGSLIGPLATIGLSILSAILGAWLVRQQGFGVLMRVREAMDRGEVPALEMMDGALLLVAGLMLLLPGFLTDIAGFLLMVPPLRRLLIARYSLLVPAPRGSMHPGRPSGPRVIEGDYRRDD